MTMREQDPSTALAKQEQAARSVIEHAYGRSLSDHEWATIRHNLLLFSKILSHWTTTPNTRTLNNPPQHNTS